MKLTNKTLYHFRNQNRKNNNWIAGNEFIIDSSYKNHICSDIIPINPSLSDIEKKIEYYTMLRQGESPFNIGEKMLELYRMDNCPGNISRLNCMYFCDEDSLEFWKHKLPSNYELYEVELNGEAFKSSSTLFPFSSRNCTYEEFLDLSFKYWNPDLSDKNINEYGEYLFNGSVYVRERVNSKNIKE